MDSLCPETSHKAFRPTIVVACTGHLLDASDRTHPRFPAHLEEAVRREMDRRLEALDARIGYCSAACGADLLFIEAMQDRNGEVNIVLPFEINDFLKTSVEFAGPAWVIRFHKAITLASSISYVTGERCLGDDVLFSLANQIFTADAQRRARALETSPYLLAVWDRKVGGPMGGTSDILSHWPDSSRLEIIDLAEMLRASAGVAARSAVAGQE